MGCGEIDGAHVGLLLGWPEGALEGCKDVSCVGAVLGRRVGFSSAGLKVYSSAVLSNVFADMVRNVRLKAIGSPTKVSFLKRANPCGNSEKLNSLFTDKASTCETLLVYLIVQANTSDKPATAM